MVISKFFKTAMTALLITTIGMSAMSVVLASPKKTTTVNQKTTSSAPKKPVHGIVDTNTGKITVVKKSPKKWRNPYTGKLENVVEVKRSAP
jgi:hypothetical protein